MLRVDVLTKVTMHKPQGETVGLVRNVLCRGFTLTNNKKQQPQTRKEEKDEYENAKKDQAPPGIDPGTCALQVHRSTTEPQSRLRQKFVELLFHQARVL